VKTSSENRITEGRPLTTIIRRAVLIAAIAVAFVTAGAQPSEKPTSASQSSPTATVARFFASLKSGDIDTAIGLTAPVDDAANDSVRTRYQQAARAMQEFEPVLVVGHLQLSDAAVVIIWENSTTNPVVDLDPICLVRSADRWLILYLVTEIEDLKRPYLLIHEKARLQLPKLGNWFDEQKPAIQSMLRQK
jgi:hypothetical protein